MIPLHFQTIAPYLHNKTRLIALHSLIDFGSFSLSDDRPAMMLNNFIDNISNQNAHDLYSRHHSIEYPDLKRGQVYARPINSDILLKDTFRHHEAIRGIYRRGQPDLYDIKKIYDPSTKIHHSISRGYERHLMDTLNRIDSEMVDRKTLRPVLN